MPIPSTAVETSSVIASLDQSWASLVGHLAAAAEVLRSDPVAENPALRASGYRYLLNLINAALEQEVFSADAEYPEVGHLQDSTKRYGTESPDCLFGHFAVDPKGTYRLTGVGGRARYLGVTVYSTMRVYEPLLDNPDADFGTIFATATGSTLGAISNPGGLALDEDGNFEVIISATPQEGNWLPLDPQGARIMTRQYFYDWTAESPYHFSVERLDQAGPGPKADPESVQHELTGVGRFVDGFAHFWAQMYAAKNREQHNRLVTQPALQAGYAGDGGHIAYGGGVLELGPDEAAIITVKPPVAHFWNIHLGDYWGQSLDYTFRQTSLNGHMAHIEDDGTFTAMVAHRDPGVANWLDTADNTILRVCYRWWLCPSPEVPTPAVQIVSFDDLDDVLPASVARISTESRRLALDNRRRAVFKRYQR